MRFGGLAADSSAQGNLLDGMPQLLMPDCPAALAAPGSAAVQLAGSDVTASQYSCSARGVCALGQCLCDEGYAGLRCEIRCEAGWGGYICTEPACPCGPRGSCTVPGVCECAAGWAGAACEEALCPQGCAQGVCQKPGVCVCSPGWQGDDCAQPLCPVGCSEHGTCLGPAACQCDAQWQGHACRTPVCAAGCLAHGTCAAPGQCKCDAGWSGEACDYPVCPMGGVMNRALGDQRTRRSTVPSLFAGIEQTEGRVCSGHGRCGAKGCACEVGWKGHACEEPICLRECAMHGACIAPGLCKCVPGWTGADCATPVCFAQSPPCAGHGNCTGPATCSCEPGWHAHDCHKPVCEGGCSHHGECVAPGQCQCVAGWAGESCSLRSSSQAAKDLLHTMSAAGCVGTSPSQNCSGHGSCEAPGVCRCEPGWSGAGCEQPQCIRQHGCRGRGGEGVCVAPRTCACNVGFAGDDCGEWSCPNECSAHGACVGPNTCRCFPGYSGSDCSQAACKGGCGGHGECTAPDECTCRAGWKGSGCGEADCGGDGCGEADGRGACTAPGTCKCNAGWGGADCSRAACPNDCSAHGACTAPHTCACYEGWGGADCSRPACANNCSAGAGRGVCASPGMCRCEPGWGSIDCSEAACPHDCTGHGICSGPGQCRCFDGWHGADCSEVVLRPADSRVARCGAGPTNSSRRGLLCHGHGHCPAEKGGCECFEGWEGEQCDQPACPAACHGRGECTAPGECHCEIGWGGKQCETPTCALEGGCMYGTCAVIDAAAAAAAFLELPASAPNAPARMAAATAKQQCSCYSGWKGARCSEPICPQACHMETRQGICASPGVCQCLAGWSGAACDRPGCKDMCNGHGPCLAGPFPVCSCGVGWAGPSCAEPACPEGCSGRGECVSAGNCKCEAGWGGASCAEADCGEVEHGACVNVTSAALGATFLEKACFAGWRGANCSEPICPSDCSGHGSCVAPGQCACSPGFVGLACEVCKSGICFATSPEWMEARGANLSGIAVDAARGVAYVSTWSSPASLLAVNLTDMAPVGEVALTAAVGEERVRVLLLDNARGFLYAATFAKPARVVKMRVAGGAGTGAAEMEAGAMERVTAVDLPRESGIVSGVLDEEGAFGFFGTYTSPGVIARVELHAGREPRPAGRIELNQGEDNLYVALRDGAYAYFGTCVGEGTVLVKVHLPTFQRVSTIHLAGVGYLSAGTLELPGPGAAAATAVLATFTRPANLVRLELSPAWSAERHDVTATKLSLGEGNDDAYAVAALPGMVAVVLSASPGRLAFAPLPKLDEIRLLPLPGGQVGRGLAAISDRELLLGSYGGAPGLLARVTVDGSCDQGGCICSGAEKDLVGSGAACSRTTASINLAPQRADLALGPSAGVVSALATNPLSGLAYAATWGKDGAAAQVQAIDLSTMGRRGPPTALRAGFDAVLAPERNVHSLLVMPRAKLLFVAMGLAPEVGTLVQFSMADDGSLSRRAALGMPDLTAGLGLALLAPKGHGGVDQSLIYLLEQSSPPNLVAVDALTLKIAVRWPLLARDREVGCGVLLPGGDVLLGMLGTPGLEMGAAPALGFEQLQLNATEAVDAGHARTHIVRLRTSDRAALASAEGLERAAELPLPASQLVCALSGPLGDFAYFATATVPAQLYKLSVGEKLLALDATLALEADDGPVTSCALDAHSRRLYLGMGGASGRVVAVSLDSFARLRGSLQSPGWLVAGASTVAGGSVLFAASAGSGPANPPGLLPGSAPAPGASLPGRQLLVRLDDAAACGSCSERGLCTNGACACFAGYAGDACERGPQCPGDCHGRGQCLAPGSCSCTAGWTGADCSKPACPNGCSRHGVCGASGACACSDGWSGADCGHPVCETNCSGRGACEAPSSCRCVPGWGGHDCAEPRCPEGCNRHGACDVGAAGEPACACFEGWAGELCDEALCPADCSGKGQCVSPGVCRCSALWSGPLCDTPTLASGCVHGAVLIDAVSGTPGTCSCFEGWRGHACDERACPASCRGECTENGCRCPNPYLRGDDCSQPYCGATACSGHGHCALPPPGVGRSAAPRSPVCVCVEGRSGEECEKPVCSAGCGHGTCISPGHCKCEPGWTGARCQMADCELGCNLHGKCVGIQGNRTCQCSAGWGGSKCDTPLCPMGSMQVSALASLMGAPGLAPMVPMMGGGGKDLRLRVDPATGTYGVGHGFSGGGGGGGAAGLGDDELTPQTMNYAALLQLSSAHAAAIAQSAVSCSAHGSCVGPGTCLCDKGWGGADCSSGCAVPCEHGTCDGTHCACLPGWRGAACAQPDCGTSHGANCSWPRGECTRPGGACACKPLFYGPDCSIGDGVTERTCFSAGRCDERGVCFVGWAGDDCELPECLHNCSGRGRCKAAGRCECDAGYEGFDCAKPVCKHGCSSNGLCLLPGLCACASGWTGSVCDVPLCAGACSAAGRCVAPGLCLCEAGRDGDDCSRTSSGEVAVEPTCPSHCRGHGQCVRGACVCEPGYHGLSCQPQCDHECSAHGVCTGPGLCACSNGWAGKGCTEPHCSSGCSGRGRCTSPGNCRCQAGWTGFDCSRPACPRDCGGHGECAAPQPGAGRAYGSCTCDGGWRGPTCEIPVCAGGMGNCSGHGACMGPGDCSCDVGWRGHDCSEAVCATGCSGHGACTAPGTCTCLPGWRGAACDRPRCASNAAGDCSGADHGACLKAEQRHAACACLPGWRGVDCSQAVCPGGCVRGRCVEPGRCACFEGWTGADCAEAICPRNCSGRGFCESPGTCICNAQAPPNPFQQPGRPVTARQGQEMEASAAPLSLAKIDSVTVSCSEIEQEQGSAACARAALLLLDSTVPAPQPEETLWGGVACELRRCPSSGGADDCSGQGKCLNGTCACDHGWGGRDCSMPHCPNDCNAPQGMCLPGGECECLPGWVGSSCGEPLCTANCSGHGVCTAPFACECDENHFGDSCNQSDCSNVAHCSGHGDCAAPDVCACHHGWGGPACDDEVCPGDCNCLDPTNRSSCHGTCMVAGLCLCQLGWSGRDCATRICPRNCHGRGQCVSGACHCRAGWEGADCGTGLCPLNCSGHGTCDGDTSLCTCLPGYSGRSCEQVACTDCSGHGHCVVAHECTCDSGWGGPSCGRAVCPNDCSGPARGTCLGPNKCACALGWSGSNCSLPICNAGCSGHGTCTAPDLCACAPGWKGAACAQPACAKGCNGRGDCTAPNTCKCHAPWGGPDCSGKRCERAVSAQESHAAVALLGGEVAGSPQASEAHSTCRATAEGKAGMPVACVCDAGWTGADCCTPACPDGCGEHGSCAAPYRCACQKGWGGPSCEVNLLCRDDLNACSGHGRCEASTNQSKPGMMQCACDAGWQGRMCQLRVCPADERGPCGGAERGLCLDGVCQCTSNHTGVGCEVLACPRGCSDKGYCGADGRCHCAAGYAGDDCSERGCPSNCSGHGSCDGGYTCMCEAGYTGADCSLRACASDCTGHGYCYNGSCRCFPNWEGDACDRPMLCPPHHGHGKCVCDPTKSLGTKRHARQDGVTTMHVVCNNVCDPGWAGPECAVPACPGGGNCSGRGACSLSPLSGGACACEHGHSGYDCSLRACPASCGAAGNASSSPRGMCYDGTCFCRPGWVGEACEREACAHDCGEFGHCLHGTCSCEPGWSGVACEVPVCLGGGGGGAGLLAPHAHAHSAAPCQPHGACRSYLGGHRCECEKGWTGVDCMLRVCEGDCSLHGVCVNGSCFCAPGFHGRGCELLSCTGSGESTAGCNGKGECVEGVCACNDGWGGQDCAERACPKDCSGRGICSKGVCTCMTGWSGPACDVPGCPAHCSGNGYCDGGTAHAVCKCYPGWEGLDCATSTCSKGCSGHGSCDANSTCRCDEGWAGFDCSLSECPEGCSGIGICLGGACMCPGNTFGAACELNVCAGTPPCNANGKCVISAPIDAATGIAIIGAVPEPRCECHEGYRGLDCSLADCKGGCSGRGECLGGLGPHAVAACLCEHGWGGADCSMPVCATNCSGRGACVNGSCWCEPGWSGPECSWQRCLFDCSGRGVCNGRGACHCAPGWRGLDCSLVASTSGDEGADASVVTRSCAAHCLDGCQEQCSAVQEVMGGEHADDCLLHCTDLCVPACGEAQGRAHRKAEASRELPGSRSAQGAAPPPPPVAIARDARELLDEEVADGVSMPMMVEDRDPPREVGSEFDDLDSMAANWAL